MKNKKILMIIASIALVLIIILGSSYAYLRVKKIGSNQNISIANFGLVIKEDMKDITLDKEVPKSDEEGLKNTPNTFVIKNQGDVKAKYRLSLIDGAVASTMSNLDIRYRVKRTRSTGEETGEVKSLGLDGVFDEGIIAPSEEISFELVIWINHDANPNGLIYSKVLSLEGFQADTQDTSGANPPEMLDNMIPVYYSKTSDTEGVWRVADASNQDASHKWYDYNDFKWANAVTVKESNGTLNEDGSMTFDGVDDYYNLDYANYDFGNTISLVARVKFNVKKVGTNINILMNHESAGAGLIVTQNKIKLSINIKNNGYVEISSDNEIDTASWYTIVGVYDGHNTKLYINKELIKTSKDVSENIVKSSVPFLIAANPDGNTVNGYANITVSDAFIYDDALTEDEVSKYFSGEITDYPKDNLLVEKTEFNELDTRQKYLEASAGTEVKMEDISSMWVWIPRYKYTIFNGNNGTANEQMINVEFEKGIETTGTVSCKDKILTDDDSASSEVCTDTTNGSIINGKSTYTHPAFKFGDDELVGFWFAKFEMSTDNSTCLENQSETNCSKEGLNILIKPNQTSLRYINLPNMFINIRNMELYGNIHGFPQSNDVTSNISKNGELTGDSNNLDTHVLTSMENGAVTYLAMSKYGKYGNDLYKGDNKAVYSNLYEEITNGIYIFKTGYSKNNLLYNNLTLGTEGEGYLGAGASTTGTVYGVYDDRLEYMMGTIVNKEGKFYDNNRWSTEPIEKYYVKYSYNSNLEGNNIKLKGKLGDATKEILKKFNNNYKDETGTWFDKISRPISSNWPWFVKYRWPGITSSSGGQDKDLTTRPVLTITRDFPWKDN